MRSIIRAFPARSRLLVRQPRRRPPPRSLKLYRGTPPPPRRRALALRPGTAAFAVRLGPRGSPVMPIARTAAWLVRSRRTSPPANTAGMPDKPADAACTHCGDGGKREASANCIVCGDKRPSGLASTADCPTCGMDGGLKPAGSDRLCEHCGMQTNPVGHAPGAPCTVCGEPASLSTAAATQAAPGARSRELKHRYPRGHIRPGPRPRYSAAWRFDCVSPAGTQAPPASTQTRSCHRTPTPDAPGAPQEAQVTVTIIFKADMVKVQVGQAALHRCPRSSWASCWRPYLLRRDLPGRLRLPGSAECRRCLADPSLCKSGVDGACTTTIPISNYSTRRK